MAEDIAYSPLDVLQEKMNKTLGVLRTDFASLRAGRANPHLLDRVQVDYYGSPTPIAQLANISSPEPRVLVISVWDASIIQSVEKAIQASDIGIHPSNDGKVIRLFFPELTEERRMELNKLAHRMAEESKVALRAIRREAMSDLGKQKKANLLTEDDLKLQEKQVQKHTDEFVKQVDTILAEKEQEILSI